MTYRSIPARDITRGMIVRNRGRVMNVSRGSVNTHLTIHRGKRLEPVTVVYRHDDLVVIEIQVG